MNLKTISLIICVLIIVEMLPVKQIGKALGQNAWCIELPHNVDNEGKLNLAFSNHPYLLPASFSTTGSCYTENKVLAYLHFSAHVPSNHSAEIDSPPPDLF